MTDLYLDVDKRIKSGELLPNFRDYHRTILGDKNLRNLFIHYLKYKRNNPNLPFISQENIVVAIRNLALYGILDAEHKQIIVSKIDILSNKKDDEGRLVPEAYLIKKTNYKINSKILAFMADIVMEVVDSAGVNNAIAEYYGIKKGEIMTVKDWALKLSLLLIEPDIASSYKFSHYMYALVDSYKMNVLVCIYAKRHQDKMKWQSLPDCDFTLPEFSDEEQFAIAFKEFGYDKDLESKNNEEFIKAFEKNWKTLNKFSDGRFSFKVVPKLNYEHFKKYLRLTGTPGVKIDTEVKNQLINYLGFLSKINPTFGLANAYKQILKEIYLPITQKRARTIALNIEKNNVQQREKIEKRFQEIFKAVIEDAVDKYDPLFFWEKIDKKHREFVLGEIHNTTNKDKFKIIPLSEFIYNKVMLTAKEIRKEYAPSTDWEVLMDDEVLDEMSMPEENRGSGKGNPEAKAGRKNQKGVEISIEENNKDKLLVIEDFAHLALEKSDDPRLVGVSESQFVWRLRYWEKVGILIPRERRGKHKIRFYHRDQLKEISRALDQAEMNQMHKVKGCYSLKEAKNKIGFKKCLNTFRNRIGDLVSIGKLPGDVKRTEGYIFKEEQMDIIKRELN
ncbi:MAG: hypothetical protein V1804_04515 [Patescibacteria group bacterium]